MSTFSKLQGKPEDFDRCFPQAIDYDPASKTFEVGLVLGGTVSAGAYTAGVIDFLIEALCAWQEAREAGNASVPDWKVKINVVTGTSGGGVTAMLLAKALSYKFAPVRKSATAKQQGNNPLYRIWVDELDISKMLDTADLDGPQPAASLLNSEILENSAAIIADFSEAFPDVPRIDKPREYVANPLPIYLTLTNLRGIPYRIDMGSGLQQEYVNHADHVRLAVFSQGPNPQYQVRGDEFVLGAEHANALNWSDAVQFALGTSAFPLGFPLRSLSRPVQHYRYRAVVVPDADNPIRHIEPDWTQLAVTPIQTSQGMVADIVPDTYHFAAADGGMTNNEPLELCRTALAGHLQHNPRDGRQAFRGLILIDPFADKASLGPDSQPELLASIVPLLSAWKNQARYDSRDLLLAGDSNVFSRFMITAQRDGEVRGSRAIATACASAFGGFLERRFRQHDFLLGRKNCQDFLKNTFHLPVENELVKNWATANPNSPMIINEGRCVQLIPLYGLCQND
ncbi:MAG: patatin-like phospholipase family protein, partial [Gammaproteobacteria bacterium]